MLYIEYFLDCFETGARRSYVRVRGIEAFSPGFKKALTL